MAKDGRMLFQDIALLDEDLKVRTRQSVVVEDGRIAFIGEAPPPEPCDTVYPGTGRLLMPGFYNNHAHTPMTLLRGYGENLALSDWLHRRIFPFEARLTGKDVYWGMMLGIAESLRYGIVSAADMYNFCEDMAQALVETGVKGNIGRHIVAFGDENLADLDCFKEAKAFRAACHGAGEGRVLADLSLHAEYTSTPKVVRQLAEYAVSEGARMQVHVSETKDEVEGCRQRHGKTPPRYLYDLGLFDVPATAAHCVHLEEEDRALLAEKGVTVASCPISNLKLASGVCDASALLRHGINLSLGTDSVASNNSLDFLEEMKVFALVQKGAHGDPARITPKEAVYAATRAGALAQGRADCGRMAVGCKADLIVLDIDKPNMHPAHDLLGNLVYAACGGDVLMTMVDGRVLYQDGAYRTLDLERVAFEAERAVKGVLGRM